ncbi:Ran GAP Rna1, partial [Dispira parvispora]
AALLHDIFTGRLREDVKAAVKYLCDALMDLPELIELNLSDNAFGPIGAESMYDFIVNSPALQTLKINNNGLGIQGGRLIAKALQERQERHAKAGEASTLRCLVAGRNRLENGSGRYLADAFAAHGTFEEIRMPQNGIRPEGIRTLCRRLTQCPKLHTLDLQDNTFTPSGSLALAEALSSWPELTHLNVADCLLGAKGGLAVSLGLRDSCPDLKELFLSYNEIEHDGVMILAQAVAKMKKITTLDLNGNRFDAESVAVEQIKNALEDNGCEDALGSLSDMEDLTDDESEEEASSEEEEESDVDDLAESLGKGLKV